MVLKLLLILITIAGSGCVTMGKKEYQRQVEMWQSVGRLTGLVECQNILLSTMSKQDKTNTPVKEPIK